VHNPAFRFGEAAIAHLISNHPHKTVEKRGVKLLLGRLLRLTLKGCLVLSSCLTLLLWG